MTFLNLILSILKGFSQVKDIFQFLSKHKWWAVLLAISIISTSYFSLKIISKNNHNVPFDSNTNYDKVTTFVDKILKKCGDKTGISISSVRLDYDKSKDAYLGSFFVVRACDLKEINNDCLVDLKNIQPIFYSKIQEIDFNSYQFLLRLGNQFNSARFYLRDRNNIQDLSSLDKYSSIKYIVKNTNWASQQSLYYLWVTSIISNNHVLYVITYLSGTANEKPECSDPNIILNNIKYFLSEL